MKFPHTTFTLSTAVLKNSPEQRTIVTIAEGDIDDAIVIASSVSGNSPRVKHQSNWRRNGVPPNANFTPIEWFGSPKQAKIPETISQVTERAKRDPEYLANLRKALEAFDHE